MATNRRRKVNNPSVQRRARLKHEEKRRRIAAKKGSKKWTKADQAKLDKWAMSQAEYVNADKNHAKTVNLERSAAIKAGKRAAEVNRLQAAGVSVLAQCKYCPNCGTNLEIVNQGLALSSAITKD